MACGAVLLATFCGGMAGGVSPFLLTPVKEEIQLTALQNSLFASSTFIGMWAGSFLGGVASDACGPGRTMVAALGTMLLGGGAPSLLASATAIVVARIVVGIGMTCPPIGLNVFVVASLARDVPVTQIYRGVLPFVAVDILRLGVVVAFPALTLYLVKLLE